ncbi:MAG: NAD(P)/FAD-dependent oxidoreductase, partial [Methylococcales bacterium]|nr:NAD(P)/FAD-dependent oxidoreductase [Methylococcales bacterium]
PAFEDGDDGLPFPMAEGTLPHLFEGGWLWVIPFDNHVKSTNPRVSVGLLLDPRLYPEDKSLTPEEEFFHFIERFPSINKQLYRLKSVRSWIRAPRIQYGSRQVVGDRWALLGHAAGFIDPLYSKGLYVTFACIFTLADQLLKAADNKDYRRETFLPLEVMTDAYLKSCDRLIANSYKSWADPRLWRVYSVLWLLGAYTELIKLNSMRMSAKGCRAAYVEQLSQLSCVGGGYEGFAEVAQKIDLIIEAVDLKDEGQIVGAVVRIESILRHIDWMPLPFLHLLEGKTALPKHKIRFDIFQKRTGFMRSGSYRRHFFGDHTMWSMIPVFIKEKIKYSPLYLNYRQRTQLSL